MQPIVSSLGSMEFEFDGCAVVKEGVGGWSGLGCVNSRRGIRIHEWCRGTAGVRRTRDKAGCVGAKTNNRGSR